MISTYRVKICPRTHDWRYHTTGSWLSAKMVFLMSGVDYKFEIHDIFGKCVYEDTWLNKKFISSFFFLVFVGRENVSA